MTEHLWLARWMRQTMNGKELSAEAWARKAGIAGTTLTRFLGNPLTVGPPSTRTLAKLAAAVHEPFPAPRSKHGRMVAIPVLSATMMSSGCPMDQAVMGEIEVPARFSHCLAMVCDLPTGGMSGILPGDTLVYDPDGEEKDGALLVALWPNGKCGPLRVIGDTLREEAPGAATHSRATVAVMGLLVHMTRDLSPA